MKCVAVFKRKNISNLY